MHYIHKTPQIYEENFCFSCCVDPERHCGHHPSSQHCQAHHQRADHLCADVLLEARQLRHLALHHHLGCVR